MPTYDYRCKACGHTFELFQSMSEREKRKCPKCEKNSLERLIGAGAGLIFKGSGYYLTDYRSKSYEDGAKAEKEASKPAEVKGDTKEDAKGAGGGEAKAEAKPSEGKPEGKTASSAGPVKKARKKKSGD